MHFENGGAEMRIPRHLAIIMDGNGRWAEQRGLPRILGHHHGVETAKVIIEESRRLGLSYLTLYAFSSENWGRPEEEVDSLMSLLNTFLERELETLLTHRIRLNVIGAIHRLPEAVQHTLIGTMERTANNRDMVLTLALSYGARDEILGAVKAIAGEVAVGRLGLDAVDEECFSGFLQTAGMPDPDFLIRTSGEIRISNFLLWQLAYAEIYFTPVLWPDFSPTHLHEAFTEFSRRQRRYGLTADQCQDDVTD
ncbi:undecaprenyl diphosphate synthase [Syntrophotalea carbinolica DSM 2380]|uniref:Isoprenyl transferase n=2 Tax=Syntrophotalea carbinolica TaxID=19 RepID=Q3A399_SYNC1|nr:undecaprenyl diphosphate synthase [Syntrophotalea carbinolica DSM 2380]